MSELINKNGTRIAIRWKLLTTASAIALLGYTIGSAQAADADRPTIWIELDGQLSRLDDGVEPFAPPLMDARPSIFAPSQKFDRPPRYAIDGHGEISSQAGRLELDSRSVDSYRPLRERSACAPADLSDLQNISIEFCPVIAPGAERCAFRRYKSAQQ